MSNLRAIAARLNWYEVLTVLGRPTNPGPLPALATCPVCGGTARVFPDSILAGPWYFCGGCSFAGTAWDLTANLAGIEVSDAVDYLASLLKITISERAKTQAVRQSHRLKAVADFVKNALTGQRQNHDYIRQRLRHPQVLGETTKASLREIKCRPLPGADKNYLILPFFDLPGRPSGVWLASSDSRTRDAVTGYRCLLKVGKRVAGGLAFPEALIGQEPLAILTNTERALNLCGFRQHRGEPLLPACLVRPEYPCPPWLDWLAAGRKVLVWSDTLTAESVGLARRFRGRVCAETLDVGFRGVFTEWLPEAQLNKAWKKSQPWLRTVEPLLRTVPPAEAIPTLERLGMDPPDVDRFLRNTEASLREAIATADVAKKRTVYVAGHVVEETPDGWFADGSLISDTVLEIDQVVQGRREVRYLGKARQGGYSVPFSLSRREVERRGLSLAADLMLQHERVARYSPRWSRRGAEIATGFRTPRPGREPRCAFEPVSDTYELPQFTYRQGAEPVVNPCSFDATLPGAQIPPPTGSLTADEIDAFRDAAPVLWAMLLAVSSMALAPLAERKPLGLLVARGPQDELRPVFHSIGCPDLPFRSSWSAEHAANKLAAYETDYGWPSCIPGAVMDDRARFKAWYAASPRRGIAIGDWMTVYAAYATGGWLFLSRSFDLDGLEVLPRVFSEFIAHVFRTPRPYTWRADGGFDLVRTISVALAQWWVRISGDRRVTQSLWNALTQADDKVMMGCRLVKAIYAAKKKGHLTIRERKTEIGIPFESLGLLYKASGVRIGPRRAVKLWKRTKAMTREFDGAWWFQREWWEFVTAYNKRKIGTIV